MEANATDKQSHHPHVAHNVREELETSKSDARQQPVVSLYHDGNFAAARKGEGDVVATDSLRRRAKRHICVGGASEHRACKACPPC